MRGCFGAPSLPSRRSWARRGSVQVGRGRLDRVYRHPAGLGGRAWLRTNFVATLDGSISGADGRSGSINTASDQHVFGLHRALADVILVGAQTVRTEGYRAVDLADWQREIRSRQGLRPFPTLAVVSRSLDLDPAMAYPDRPHGSVMIITTGHPTTELEPFRTAGIEVSSVEARKINRLTWRAPSRNWPRPGCRGSCAREDRGSTVTCWLRIWSTSCRSRCRRWWSAVRGSERRVAPHCPANSASIFITPCGRRTRLSSPATVVGRLVGSPYRSFSVDYRCAGSTSGRNLMA